MEHCLPCDMFKKIAFLMITIAFVLVGMKGALRAIKGSNDQFIYY